MSFFSRFRYTRQSLNHDLATVLRKQIFYAVFISTAILATVPYVVTMVHAVRGEWHIRTIVISLLYFLLIGVSLSYGISYKIRAWVGCIIFYFLGLFTLVALGPISSGRVYLLFFSIVTCLLLGFRPALVSIVLNFLTMMAVGWAINTNYIHLNSPVDGQGVWYIVSITFLWLNITAILAVGILIQSLERALKEEKKLSTAIHQSPVSIVITDIKGEIEYVNPRFCEITGYSADEAAGQNPRILQSGDMADGFYDRLWKTISAGNKWHGVIKNKKKNGDDYWEDATISPILSTNGKITNYVAVKEDITERIENDKKLKSLQNQIIETQKMEAIGTLAAGIAHDFNNILTPVLGLSDLLLLDTSNNNQTKDSLKQIQRCGLRAKDLVQQILLFCRKEQDYSLQMVKIQPIIIEVLKLLRSTIPTSIKIKQDISDDCGPVQGTPAQLNQIILNLATNAYHSMQETGGELTVGLQKKEIVESELVQPEMKPGRYICLMISDTGKGIENGLVKKIFDPFFTTKERGKGTGMGLSVVHGIVTSMGGAIQVMSAPGRGTDFYVYLPEQEEQVIQQPSDSMETYNTGVGHILLVDDEQLIVLVLTQILESLGYQVDAYTSSLEALETFRTESGKYDLVITDLEMPDMSGEKIARELINIKPDIPILLSSGFSENMSEEKALSLGIRGFMMKPLTIKDLSEKIHEILD